MRMLRGACVALALVVAACGSSKQTTTTTPGPQDAVNQTFTGTLSDGSLVTLSFAQGTALTAAHRLPAAAAATVSVTGTVTLPGGTSYPLTGSYDPVAGTFSVSGGGYSLSGTYSGGVVQGDCTVGSVTLRFVAMMGTGVRQYCGTYSVTDGESGSFNLVLSNGRGSVLASNGKVLQASVNGTTLVLAEGSESTSIPNAVSEGGVAGSFAVGDGTVTFGATTAACEAILHPPVCASFTYSAWSACPQSQVQTRTVVTQSPAGCAGGSPVLTQACTYVPPGACEAPATNAAGPSDDKYTTTASGPPAGGGTIPDGTYDLVLSVYYGAPSDTTTASNDRRRFVVAAGAIEVIASDATTLGKFVGDFAFDPLAKTLTVTPTCASDPAVSPVPIGTPMVIEYTLQTSAPASQWNAAGATLLKLHTTAHDTGKPKQEVYVLQP